MARVIQHQLNPWGRQAGSGEEPQRSDLWLIDLSSAVRGIATQLNTNVPPIPAYFAQSVSFPELRVRADQFRRDSRPYNMPSFDDPPDPVRITFILDTASGESSSRIYSVLNKWRSLVRAGRGAMSTENQVTLNSNYRIDFAFNVGVYLLKGGQATVSQTAQQASDPLVINRALAIVRAQQSAVFSLQSNFTSTAQMAAATSQSQALAQQQIAARQAALAAIAANTVVAATTNSTQINNDLQYSGMYTFKNAWLGGFKISDLTYQNSGVATVEAQFYVEDVFDNNGNKLQQ